MSSKLLRLIVIFVVILTLSVHSNVSQEAEDHQKSEVYLEADEWEEPTQRPDCASEQEKEERPDVIRTTLGPIRGKYMTSKWGRRFEAYLGIPYAQPPTENLRFKPPVPPKPWKKTLDATNVHDVCPQRDIYRRSAVIEGTEDCLYLNVYTPQSRGEAEENSTEPLLPVMIFFHGGGFLCGGGNVMWYGPDVLLDKDIMLVIPNYRLGALGFLSTGDLACPGNNGLKDQNLAIRWAKENAKIFGGDPDRITLFGESAGAVSVHLHMASPLSKDLFHAGISQSGSAHNLWALAPKDQAVRHARQLARAFNCPIEDSRKLIDCLKKIDAYDLVKQDKIFMKWDFDPMIPFKPVVEPADNGAFLPEHPTDVLKAGKMANIPWIIGLNSQDGALRVAGLFANPHLLDEINDNFHTVIPISLLYDETTTNHGFITHKIRNFYFGDKKIDNTSRTEIVDMYTDGWFLNGIDYSVRLHLEYSSQPTYYYLFSHRGVSSFTKIFGDPHNDYGVCHADELQYMFPVSDCLFPEDTPSDDDIQMRKMITRMWVNFAKSGDPTPEYNDDRKWQPVRNENMDYYHINGLNPKMQTGLLLERVKFWRKLPVHAKQNEEIKVEL